MALWGLHWRLVWLDRGFCNMKRISIFGATGSIGQSTLDIIRHDRAGFHICALTGARNIEQLAQDAIEFGADYAITSVDALYEPLKDLLSGTGVTAMAGRAALVDAGDLPVDLCVSAIVGAAGLEPGYRALARGADLALANKESMVAAGQLMKHTARNSGGQLLPVDSEHSAIFQALQGENRQSVERVIITASGGAFRDWSLAQLQSATPAQAQTHPNWDMGQRITIDSASMFNKALEVIEAKELFDLSPDQIEVVIHPQSLIHSVVGFCDAGMMAHIGPHDMRHAIAYAMYYPNRPALTLERLDLAKIGRLDFMEPDRAKYPALDLAYHVMQQGGLMGAAFNAAKETALDAFIAGQIGFLTMSQVVKQALDHLSMDTETTSDPLDLDNILAMDALARTVAIDEINKI